jgi:hypothetical protein
LGQTVVVLVFWLFLVATAVATIRYGGWSERSVLACYVLAGIATAVLRPPVAHRYQTVELMVMAIDLALLIALIVITLRRPRRWLELSVGLQAICVSAHLAKALNPDLLGLGYQMMEEFSCVPATILLAHAVLERHRSRNAATIWPPSFRAARRRIRAEPPTF